MKHRPITIKEANAFVAQHHRHNKPVTGGRFAIAAYDDAGTVGVCIVGRTTARLLHDNDIAEVTRLATHANAPKNTCSYLYGAVRRIWQAMGGRRLITYTLARESGDSLRGAGWKPVAKVKKSDNWTKSRGGRANQVVACEDKIRWEADRLREGA